MVEISLSLVNKLELLLSNMLEMDLIMPNLETIKDTINKINL
jgi:hypothetical protein